MTQMRVAGRAEQTRKYPARVGGPRNSIRCGAFISAFAERPARRSTHPERAHAIELELFRGALYSLYGTRLDRDTHVTSIMNGQLISVQNDPK